jgi:hypothetical protein
MWILVLFVKLLGAAAFVQQSNQSDMTCRLESAGDANDKAGQIMYHQQCRKREAMRYQIIAAEACEPLARKMEEVKNDNIFIIRNIASLEFSSFLTSLDYSSTRIDSGFTLPVGTSSPMVQTISRLEGSTRRTCSVESTYCSWLVSTTMM